MVAAIDGALRDWQVSADAMRWTPGPVADGLPYGHYGIADEVDWDQVSENLTAFARAFGVSMAQVAENVKRFGDAMTAAMAEERPPRGA